MGDIIGEQYCKERRGVNSIHGIGWTPPGGQVNHSGGPQASPSGRTPLSPSVSAVSSDPSDRAPATRYQQVFVLGAEVAVTRSSGEVEHHWHLGETLPTGAVRVHSANAYKDCSAQRILNQNPGLIPQGMEFDVRRSNGAHEGGWVAEELSPEGTVVLRKGNLEKCLSVDQLVAENPDLVPPRPETTGQRVSSGSETGRLEAPGPRAASPQGQPAAPAAPVVERPPAAAPAAARAPMWISSAQALGPEQAHAILSRAQVAPNPVGFHPCGAQHLTTEFLVAHNLEPRHTVMVGDTRIHLSQPYSHNGARTACVGYVEGPDGTVNVRSFYRSNSQGTWRCASHCGFNGWIGKGSGSEESTLLPIPVQKTLSQLADAGLSTSVSHEDSHTAFYGALPVGGNCAPEEFASEVQASGFGSFTQRTPDGQHGDPRSFCLDHPGQGPDFARREDVFDNPMPDGRGFQASVYRSNDGQYRYMFCTDDQGRAWLGGLEKADAPVNSFGVRTSALMAGDLAMPAVEYASQVPEGFAGAHVRGSYVDASAYTHQLPPVRAFLAATRGQGRP